MGVVIGGGGAEQLSEGDVEGPVLFVVKGGRSWEGRDVKAAAGVQCCKLGFVRVLSECSWLSMLEGGSRHVLVALDIQMAGERRCSRSGGLLSGASIGVSNAGDMIDPVL